MTTRGTIAASSFAVFVALSLTASCGGRFDGQSDASGGDSGNGKDVLNGDAGWTDCSSPSGFEICGGPKKCSDCSLCTNKDPIGICGDGPNPFTGTAGCPACPDGSVCIAQLVPDGGNEGVIEGPCVQWEMGELFRREGYGDMVIYADGSHFDGTPLPTPQDCPTVSGLTLCGGACGNTCANDGPHVCLGRSPKHPYSLCVDVAPLTTSGGPVPGCTRANPPTDGQHGCLIFKDDSASQSLADIDGVYIDLATCQAAAAGYPGGADCVTAK